MSEAAIEPVELDPQSAIEQWCDQELVAEERRLRESGYSGQTFAAVLGKETLIERANDPLCRVMDQLRTELHFKLLDGDLLGAGYVSGDMPDQGRRDVQPNRWSVLRIDFENWSAEGSGIVLNDLRIRAPATSGGRNLHDGTSLTVLPSATEVAGPMARIIRARCEVRVGDRTCTVPSKAFRLLLRLVQRLLDGDGPFSPTEIYKEFYADGGPNSASYELVRQLRLRLDSLSPGEGRRLVQTLNRSGYIINLDAAEIILD